MFPFSKAESNRSQLVASSPRRSAPRGVLAIGVALALGASLLGSQGAAAGNPMQVSGTLLGSAAAGRTVQALVGGVSCAGASMPVASGSANYGVSLASGCG